jgi:O-antigen/teichoic acid export membrane protein
LLLGLTLAVIPVLILEIYLRVLVQADYRFTITNVCWILPILLNLIVNGALALSGHLTVTTAVCTWIVGQLMATLILAWYVQSKLAGFGRPNRTLARRSVSFGAKSHIGRVMLLGNYRLDVWILGAFSTSTQVGLYSVAVAWSEALFFLPNALAAVQRPDMVRLERGSAARAAARLFRIGLLATAALAVGLIVAAPFLCVGIFGEEFRGSIAQLRVLALGGFGIVALKQLSSALTAQRLPVRASIGIGVGFIATVALDFTLIPTHEGLGAAWASTVAYTLGGVIGALVFARSLGARPRELAPRPADVPAFAHQLREALRR